MKKSKNDHPLFEVLNGLINFKKKEYIKASASLGYQKVKKQLEKIQEKERKKQHKRDPIKTSIKSNDDEILQR